MAISIKKQAKNTVEIEGYLSELNLTEGSKDGSSYIRGEVAVEVEQEISGVKTLCVIPVSVFASKLKKDGGANPAYEAIKNLQEKMSSIASAGREKADKIRIKSGELGENAFYAASGELVSTIRIKNTFFNQVTGEFNPKAQFNVTTVIESVKPEVNRDGTETGRLVIKGLVVQYDGKIDIVTFYVELPAAKAYIESNYKKGATVRLSGKLRFTNVTEKKQTETAFGEPIIDEVTRTKKELIVTGGSEILDEDESYDLNEIAEGKRKRDEMLIKAKEASEKKTNNRGF